MNRIKDEIAAELFAYVVYFIAFFLPFCANATCRTEGDRVCCEKQGFDILVQGLVQSESALKACVIERDLAEANAADAKAALEKHLATPTPSCPKATPSPKTAVPVFIAFLGGALLGATTSPEISPNAKTAGAVIGLTFLGTGLALSLF
jgi:hypothetical protein